MKPSWLLRRAGSTAEMCISIAGGVIPENGNDLVASPTAAMVPGEKNTHPRRHIYKLARPSISLCRSSLLFPANLDSRC